MKIVCLNVRVPSTDFDLEKAVCNHGFFMMPPNQWIPSSKTLQRPLRLSDSNTCVVVSINQSSSFFLTVQIQMHSSSSLSPNDQQAIREQVVRMLRLTDKDEEDLREFHNLHPRAKVIGFGRIFRSPTLFEDALKSILLCNTSWRRTLAMAGELCELQGKMMSSGSSSSNCKKRKRKGNNNNNNNNYEGGGNFPNAMEVCRMSGELLERGLLGYRARYLIHFAKRVESGSIDLEAFEDEQASFSTIASTFLKFKGFGPFATANVLMCLGFYHQLPIDTETIRHLKQVHGRQSCSKKTVEQDVKQIYHHYAPFQSLAYWLELVEYYETKFGKLSELCSLDYNKISGTTLNL